MKGCLAAGIFGLLFVAAAGKLAGQATAPLEERIAAARSVKVMTAILGVGCGAELDAAHRKLDPLCAPGTHPKTEGEDNDDPKAGKEEEEGNKVLWQLAATDYSAVYVVADESERILAVTGILRPDKQMPFEKIGEVAKAPVRSDHSVVWDVLRPGSPIIRVLAKGSGGKAATITIYSVRPKSNVHKGPAAARALSSRL